MYEDTRLAQWRYRYVVRLVRVYHDCFCRFAQCLVEATAESRSYLKSLTLSKVSSFCYTFSVLFVLSCAFASSISPIQPSLPRRSPVSTTAQALLGDLSFRLEKRASENPSIYQMIKFPMWIPQPRAPVDPLLRRWRYDVHPQRCGNIRSILTSDVHIKSVAGL